MTVTDLGYRADFGMWEVMYSWRNSFGGISKMFVYKIRHGGELIVWHRRRRYYKREAKNIIKPHISHHAIDPKSITITGTEFKFNESV